MVQITITIKEETPGTIRCRGEGKDIDGQTQLEEEYTMELLKKIDEVRGSFQRIKTTIPLTMITEVKKPKKKKDENNDRSRS